jgi:hypothetical protein
MAGCVVSRPYTLKSSFTDPDIHRTKAPRTRIPKNVASCSLSITRVTDLRTETASLGDAAGRAVRAPKNIDEWLHNVLGAGLPWRGVTPHFDPQPGNTSDSLSAEISLRLAWVSAQSTAKSATVMLNLRLNRGGSLLVERDYRGMDTEMNWSSGDAELQRLVDRAFGRALDKMAADVRGACFAE